MPAEDRPPLLDEARRLVVETGVCLGIDTPFWHAWNVTQELRERAIVVFASLAADWSQDTVSAYRTAREILDRTWLYLLRNDPVP